jgi:anaerobic magnesium-protoporphyrin IX monomethyl ester cyclase
MNVVLINPNYRTKLGGNEKISAILPPLGIAYIAAVLKQNNISVSIIDMNAENLDIPSTMDKLFSMNPQLIGITSTTPQINKVYSLAREIKRLNKNIFIVVGGPHPTSLPLEVIDNKDIDFVAVGEGEITMLELCKALEKDKSYKKIDGLGFKYKRKVILNKPRKLIDNLDDIPFPAIDLLPLNKYHSAYSKYKPFANILTSRGCPGRCLYCNKQIFGFNVRMRSAQNIFNEIKYLNKKYGYKEFHIVDDLFTQDRKRVIDFCNLIKKEKLKIYWKLGNGVRVGSIDYELLKIMKQVGLYSLSFGIESGNQKILNNMKKGQTLQMCRNAVEWSNKLGLFTIGFFMIGNIGETKETILDTINFSKTLPLDVAQFSILVPFPGTEVRAIIEKEGKILEKDWGKYDNIEGKALFEHGALKKELMEEMHKQAYKEFYMRLSFVIRRILKTRSLLELKNQLIGFFSILDLQKK